MRNRSRISISILFLILMLNPIPVFAEIQKGIYVFANGGLRLRSEGNSNGRILGLIPNLKPIEIACSPIDIREQKCKRDGWLPVKFEGKYGWVSLEFVKKVVEAETSPSQQLLIVQTVGFDENIDELTANAEFFLIAGASVTLLPRLPGYYRYASILGWANDETAMFSTSFADGGASAYTVFHMNVLTLKSLPVTGVDRGLQITEDCKTTPKCLCEGKFYKSFETYYAIEETSTEAIIYEIPGDFFNRSRSCKQGIDRKLIRIFGRVKVNGAVAHDKTYYRGLRFKYPGGTFIIDSKAKKIKHE